MSEKTKKVSSRKMGRPSVAQSQKLDEEVKAKALKLFLDHGYGGVSMEAIAKAAGITKRSLYARYSDKSQLFVDALKFSKNAWKFDTSGICFKANTTLAESLQDVAVALMAQVVDPMYIKVGRMASAVADQFPEAVRQSYDIRLSPRLQSIKQILEGYKDQISEPYVGNLDMTAELFLGLISGLPTSLASFGHIRDPEFERQRIQLAVKMFVDGITKTPID